MTFRFFTLRVDANDMVTLDRWFCTLVHDHGLPVETVEELRVCLHEVVGNVILHGKTWDGSPVIKVAVRVDVEAVTLVVEDNAQPFNPLGLPEPDLATSLDEVKIGGLGFHLVRSFTDLQAYDRLPARNRLTLMRRRSRE